MRKKFKANRAILLIMTLMVYAIITFILTLLYDNVPIIWRFSVFSQDSFYLSFITNLYSGLVDFIIFTLVIWIFNQKLDKKDQINKYQNEIDDCRCLRRQCTRFGVIYEDCKRWKYILMICQNVC